jgi:hypothetical protein
MNMQALNVGMNPFCGREHEHQCLENHAHRIRSRHLVSELAATAAAVDSAPDGDPVATNSLVIGIALTYQPRDQLLAIGVTMGLKARDVFTPGGFPSRTYVARPV